MGRNSKDISDWGMENEERHLRSLNPVKNKQYLDDQTEFNPTDHRGSRTGEREGSLHGAPSVTFITLDSSKNRKILSYNISQSANVYVEGYNMYYMTNLYLSGSDTNMFGTSAKVFSFFEDKYQNRLGTENPAFSGVQILEWTVINNNNITFNIPTLHTSGDLDIILQGPAGYFISSNCGYNDTPQLLTVTDELCGTETDELCGTETDELCGTETDELCGNSDMS